MEHLLSAKQFKTLKGVTEIFENAEWLRDPWSRGYDPLTIARGKLMAIVKDEPSTRTRCSFEAAMKRLGGDVIIVDLDGGSSIAKGESLEDTIRTVSGYVDVLVMRLKSKGNVDFLSYFSTVPVLNAGDGDGEHPTQALLDAYTLWRHWRAEPLNRLRRVLFIGDLYYSRTVHSLIYLLGLDPSIEMHMLADYNSLPHECWDYIISKKLNVYVVSGSLEEVLKSCVHNCGVAYDAVYVTRWQSERHSSGVQPDDYPCVSGDTLQHFGEKTLILHPLPRGSELSSDVDKDSRAVYFEQAKNGMYVRMALLFKLFNQGD